MSIAEWQCNELRRLADKLDNEEEVSVPFVRVLVIPIMREAADTIEKLGPHSDQLEHSRWHELFGTPEKAARTLAKACGECSEAFPCRECPLYPSVGNNVYETEILELLRGDA
jgi:hypothetical protein